MNAKNVGKTRNIFLMIELQLMTLYRGAKPMKVSLGLSVLIVNVTLLTETSLGPFRGVFNRWKLNDIKLLRSRPTNALP